MPILLHLAAVPLAGLRVVTPPFTDNATPLLSVDKMMLRVSTELQGSPLHDIVNAQQVRWLTFAHSVFPKLRCGSRLVRCPIWGPGCQI